jgi:hypothetical protein
MGGLVTSTLLTLLIVPVAYAMVVGWQDRWKARRIARQAAKDAREAAAQPSESPPAEGAIVSPGD